MIFSADLKRVLGAILGAGLLLRVLFLNSRQLSTEELQQAIIVRSDSVAEMLARLRDSTSHPAPMDYFVQRLTAFLVGEAPWAARLHAVIFGVLSIWIFFRISRLLFGERVARYTTIIFAFYPLTCHYSQEARPYALFLLLALASYEVLLLKVSGRMPGLVAWVALAGLLASTLYTSFLGVAVLLAQLTGLAGSALWQGNPGALSEDDISGPASARWSHVAIYGLVAAVACGLFLPWVQFLRSDLSTSTEIGGIALVLRIFKELGDGSYPVAVLLLLGAFAGIRALLRHGRRQPFIWVVSWLASAISTLIVVEYWFGSFFGIRHVLFLAPPLILVAGYGFSFVGERLTILDRLPYRVSAPSVVYAALVVLSALWIAQAHGRKEPVDWQGTARFLRENLRSGDALTMPEIRDFLEYYDRRLAAFRAEDLDPGPGILQNPEVNRRFVVCLNEGRSDSCSSFLAKAGKDSAWRRQEFRGLTVFTRER